MQVLTANWKAIAVLAMTTLMPPAVAVAQSQRNLSDELARLAEAADNGDAKAQIALGRKYLTGSDVVQSDASAVWWFRKAADQGVREAEFEVGAAYSAGRGVEQDDAEAYRWFIKSAEHGLAPAQTKVGVALASGTGTDQDDAKAYQWFRRAAEQGNAEGQFWVGLGFQTGAAGSIDDAQAVRWWTTAAGQGVAQAQYELAHKYRSGGAGIAVNPSEAFKWLAICAALPSDVQAPCSQGRDRMIIDFGSDRLADARRKAREWMDAFERRQQRNR
jgi:TPR repeat protein